MNSQRLAAIAAAFCVAGVATDAMACLLPPPETAEAAAARTLRYQSDLWDRSESVFLVRTSSPSPSRSGGNRAVLLPILQLKGPEVRKPMAVFHTDWTSCGPAPFLDALNGQSGEVFIAYSTRAAPDRESILATLRPDDLRDPVARDAWVAAYGVR